MAHKRPTDPPSYTNPEVRFERVDVTYGNVIYVALVLVVGTAVVVVAMFWYARVLLNQERARKKSTLPVAAEGRSEPPEPRLEAIEDVKEKNVRLMPARADEYFASQRELLEKGDPQKGIEPIGTTIETLASRLPVRSAPGGSR
jgi:hypothetical protein